MKNLDDKIYIRYETLDDYYDLYVNGLNAVASGSLYLTGTNGMLSGIEPIYVNAVDSGKTGVEYDFDVISEYCIRVNDFQPIKSGELDFIFVDGENIYQLSDMYNYGYNKINIETGLAFGLVDINDISNVIVNDTNGTTNMDPWVIFDGNNETYVNYAYNTSNGYIDITFANPISIGGFKILADIINETDSIRLGYKIHSTDTSWTYLQYEPYSALLWDNQWFSYNTGTNVVVEAIRIHMDTFVVMPKVYELVLYKGQQSLPIEPLEEFETFYVVPEDMATSTNRVPMNVVDGNISTGCPFGYNVTYQNINLYSKYESKIGIIRLYATDLPSIEYVNIYVTDHWLNGIQTKVVDHLTYNTSHLNQWFEIDISNQELTGIKVKIELATGFVSESNLTEIQILPW